MIPVLRIRPWVFVYVVAATVLAIGLSGCIATSEELRTLADQLDAAHDMATATAETVAKLPGWGGVLGSAASTVLAGMGGLNSYRNATRASDPRVSNKA